MVVVGFFLLLFFLNRYGSQTLLDYILMSHIFSLGELTLRVA